MCPWSCHSAKPKIPPGSLWGALPVKAHFLYSIDSSHKGFKHKNRNKNHPRGNHCFEYEAHKNFPFGDLHFYPPEKNIQGNSSGGWRGWGNASIPTLPLSFYLSLEFFYFDSYCHRQAKYPSPGAGEAKEDEREILSLFSTSLKVNIIFLLVFLSTTETGWHIQDENLPNTEKNLKVNKENNNTK